MIGRERRHGARSGRADRRGGRGGGGRWLIGRRHDHVNRSMHAGAMHVDLRRAGWSGFCGRNRCGKIERGVGGIGKDCFVKSDVARDEDTAGLQIKTTATLMRIGVAKKDTWQGSRRKFVRCGGTEIGIAQTTKNT